MEGLKALGDYNTQPQNPTKLIRQLRYQPALSAPIARDCSKLSSEKILLTAARNRRKTAEVNREIKHDVYGKRQDEIFFLPKDGES